MYLDEMAQNKTVSATSGAQCSLLNISSHLNRLLPPKVFSARQEQLKGYHIMYEFCICCVL